MSSKSMTRTEFLARAGAAVAGSIGAASAGGSAVPSQAARWKGKRDSKIKRWDVITIGNLSRNRYWGESDAKAVRAAICTCTLITGEDFRLLVDPSLADAQEMAKELDRRAGIKPRDVTAVFVTHEHGDHFAGLAHFSDAKWLAAPPVAELLNRIGRLSRRVEAVTGKLFESVDIMPTPGHTSSHHSLRFDCDGLSILTAGDAVPTRDFFRDRRGYYNAVDFGVSAATMDRIAAAADMIVPGHDNYFLSDSIR